MYKTYLNKISLNYSDLQLDFQRIYYLRVVSIEDFNSILLDRLFNPPMLF